MKIFLILLAFTVSFSVLVKAQPKVTWIQSASGDFWKEKSAGLSKSDQTGAAIIGNKLQTVDGFGICFNELGWKALSFVDNATREKIIGELFNPKTGLRLNICRMPIGANDYSLDYYSLNDTPGDFEMKNFSIERDKKNLIPFIKSAQKYRPDLKIWGSPWTPPSWMKTNNHYACHPDVVNDMTPEQAGKEGVTQFRMKPEYLSAYALYFVKYVSAYKNEGIKITAIHPQNEMNSCQNFPSCLWNSTSLGHFIGKYLGPALKESHPDVQLWYGTYERPLVEKIDTILTDPEIAQYISGVSFQWSGKHAIPGVHSKYPKLKVMQSETECGDGSNDWKAAEYTFSLMNHYFKNGISVYSFWNSILDETGKSMWGWKQNSMISINSKTGEVTYNPEFYLLKHFSAFIEPGAYMLEITGKAENILAFRNPDNTIVVIYGNTGDKATRLQLTIDKYLLDTSIDPHTFNTFIIPKR